MKSRLLGSLCAVAILLSATTASAATTLNAGETLFYEFTTLPFYAPAGASAPNSGKITVRFIEGTFSGAGDKIRIKLYEDSPSDTPFYNDAFDAHQFDIGSLSPGTGNPVWQDLQGWVELIGVLGSIDVDTIRYNVIKDGSRYLETIDASMTTDPSAPIPIPPAVWLFASGLLGLVGMAKRKAA